jgi:hypothetical protein
LARLWGDRFDRSGAHAEAGGAFAFEAPFEEDLHPEAYSEAFPPLAPKTLQRIDRGGVTELLARHRERPHSGYNEPLKSLERVVGANQLERFDTSGRERCHDAPKIAHSVVNDT